MGIQIVFAQHELTNPSALLIRHIMCPRGADDDLCAIGCCAIINSLRDRPQSNSSYDAKTPFFELRAFTATALSSGLAVASSKLVQLRVENGLGNEFFYFGD